MTSNMDDIEKQLTSIMGISEDRNLIHSEDKGVWTPMSSENSDGWMSDYSENNEVGYVDKGVWTPMSSENSDGWMSDYSENNEVGYVELNRPRKWFKARVTDKTNLCKRTYNYSHICLQEDKDIIDELPEQPMEVTMHTEVASDDELSIQLKKEAEEIGIHKFFPRSMPTPCRCGIGHHPDTWSDSIIKKIHENFYRILYQGLRIDNDILISQFGNMKFLKVSMDRQTSWTAKVEEFLMYVDIELGFHEGYIHQPLNRLVLLALDDVHIIGCVVLEPQTVGYNIISPYKGTPKKGAIVPVDYGVNRIWVFLKYRRRGIGSTLLDIARHQIGEIPKDRIAFAEPNLVGRKFAGAYCEPNSFFIY